MTTSTVPHPPISSREQWLTERKKLLAREKELTRHYDQVNVERRRLPMVKLEKKYAFDGPGGKVSLRDLFEDRRQLIIYHFMFDPKWDKGCPGCTSFVDALGDLSLLNKSDTTFAVVSRAQSEMSAAKGHPVKMEGEAHGLSVFFQLDEDLFHTYSTYARGTESLTDSYRLLDMTPYGRQRDFEESPAGFPQKPTYG